MLWKHSTYAWFFLTFQKKSSKRVATPSAYAERPLGATAATAITDDGRKRVEDKAVSKKEKERLKREEKDRVKREEALEKQRKKEERQRRKEEEGASKKKKGFFLKLKHKLKHPEHDEATVVGGKGSEEEFVFVRAEGKEKKEDGATAATGGESVPSIETAGMKFICVHKAMFVYIDLHLLR